MEGVLATLVKWQGRGKDLPGFPGRRREMVQSQDLRASLYECELVGPIALNGVDTYLKSRMNVSTWAN